MIGKRRNAELGASLVEYGLLLALIAAIAIPSVRSMSKSTKCNMYLADVGAKMIGPDSSGRYWYSIPGLDIWQNSPADLVNYVKGLCHGSSFGHYFK